MSSKSARHGTSTSAVEVTNISSHGFWLYVGGEELFLSFQHFPWFRRATVEQILAVNLPNPAHLYWPGLDVDLAVESIKDPPAFPLLARPPV